MPQRSGRQGANVSVMLQLVRESLLTSIIGALNINLSIYDYEPCGHQRVASGSVRRYAEYATIPEKGYMSETGNEYHSVRHGVTFQKPPPPASPPLLVQSQLDEKKLFPSSSSFSPLLGFAIFGGREQVVVDAEVVLSRENMDGFFNDWLTLW